MQAPLRRGKMGGRCAAGRSCPPTVARSRDPGLHGRKPVFRSIEALAMSYFDAYIDATGCLTGYALIDLRDLGPYDWRLSARNMWAPRGNTFGRRMA